MPDAMLVITATHEEYEQIEAAGDLAVVVASLTGVEVRQQDGLLTFARSAISTEPVNGTVAQQHGIRSGPAIRVYMRPEKEEADVSHPTAAA